jgi:hypothetical protein
MACGSSTKPNLQVVLEVRVILKVPYPCFPLMWLQHTVLQSGHSTVHITAGHEQREPLCFDSLSERQPTYYQVPHFYL